MKQLLILFCVVLSTLSAQAQFGIDAGLGIGKYKLYQNGTRQERTSELTYNFGVFYNVQAGNLALRPELAYAPVFVKNDVAGQGNGILYYRNRLNYLRLSLPVIIGVITDKDHQGFEFGMGPFFSRLLKATSTAHDLDDNEQKTDFKVGSSSADDFKAGDVGLQIYLGAKTRHIVGSITDNLGYHNVSPTQNQKVVTRSFMVNLGFIF